jgi:hypothetical protein
MRHVEPDIVDGGEVTELFGDVVQGEARHAGCPTLQLSNTVMGRRSDCHLGLLPVNGEKMPPFDRLRRQTKGDEYLGVSSAPHPALRATFSP